MHLLNLPFYLDSAGTIGVAFLGGAFPAIITAVLTNGICSLFNPYSLYYSLISILIAMCTARFQARRRFGTVSGVIRFILLISALGGIIGMVFQWILLGGPQFRDVAELSALIVGKHGGILYFLCALVVNFGLNLVDKGLSALFAYLAVRHLPKGLIQRIRDDSWAQKPLRDEEILEIRGQSKELRNTLQSRMTLMLVGASTFLAIAMILISVVLYSKNVRREYTENAYRAVEFASSVIDTDHVTDYLEEGEAYPGYTETRDLLRHIRENAPGVEFLYVLKIRHDGCYVVFDLDTEEVEAYEPGDRIEFEEAFEEYLPALFAGEEIQPVESDDLSGWVLTVYRPVRDEKGNTVCYACADVSMAYLSSYVRDYILKAILIFSGFFAMILGFGIWNSRHYLVFPIGSMSEGTDRFTKNLDDQEALDKNVNKILSLDIRTEDEVEKLYHSICMMASGMAEQIRSVRHYAEATSQMQNGLIMIMADMVENRDSDTGAHVQKTAAYVRIILNGLKKKGYYTEKLTPRYMEDVVMSAPLHDVGKINIPDAVLNKPGKLTEEEYEIMKTHTTAGKTIIERAIRTVQGGTYLKEARNMAAYHHERWDGKGYPEGLTGEVIPLSARVMAVADVFDALASPRVYKPAFPLEKALDIIKEGAGTQFDPRCVEVFMDSLTEVKVILKKYHG